MSILLHILLHLRFNHCSPPVPLRFSVRTEQTTSRSTDGSRRLTGTRFLRGNWRWEPWLVDFRLQEFPWHGLNSDTLVFFFFSLCPATNWSSQNLALFPQPPIVPKVTHEGDTSNFDVYPEDDWKKDPPVPQKDLEIFENFWTPVSPLRHRTNECLADCRHNIVMVVLQELSLRAGKKQNPYLSKCVCVWGGQRPYSRPPQKKDTNNWYCDMYRIAEWFAFYIFIYDLSLCSFLYVFFNPAYAKKKKSNHNNLVAFKT